MRYSILIFYKHDITSVFLMKLLRVRSSTSTVLNLLHCIVYVYYIHRYHFAQLLRNMRIQTEHSIPSTNVRVRIRTRRFAKIFENLTNRKDECKQTKYSKIFVRSKGIACAP